MGRFNLSQIEINDRADITVIDTNFRKIEQNARTASEIDTSIATAKNQAINIAAQQAASNYYSKGTVDNYLSNKKDKNDFIVLGGNVTLQSQTTQNVTINYPSGCNFYNCTLISCAIVDMDENEFIYDNTSIINKSVTFEATRITLRIKNLLSSPKTVGYKIILMKINLT